MADLTEYEAGADRSRERVGEDAGRVRARPVAAAEQLGPVARESSRTRGSRPSPPGWPDDPNTVDEANATPRCSRTRRSEQVADHFDDVIGKLEQAARGRRALVRRAAHADPRRARARDASVAIDPAPFRGVLPLPISALQSSSPVLGNPPNHGRAVPLTYEQFRYAFANAVTEDEAHELYNTYAVPGRRSPAVPGGDRQPQPVDRGEGQDEEPRPRPTPHHRRRARTTPSRGRSRTRRSSSSGATRTRSPRCRRRVIASAAPTHAVQSAASVVVRRSFA